MTIHNFAVPDYVVGQSEAEASKEGRTLADFYYGCLGYSVYMIDKDSSAIKQQTKTQLPVCVGLEVCHSYPFSRKFISLLLKVRYYAHGLLS